eukprot:CAMPEP_0177687412 /NCGR_PEP_ID=MMETSP0447-20121125/34117_1 /TAXON_ID=0 /ORGANISM="Stygamoeba regulata, Strain BSH-02190019" /LENGTH=205 /DNA_ID=CAMNT_0019197657 /DNA_START=87 /DNA_END=701 /DNA_ORIENTATION=+
MATATPPDVASWINSQFSEIQNSITQIRIKLGTIKDVDDFPRHLESIIFLLELRKVVRSHCERKRPHSPDLQQVESLVQALLGEEDEVGTDSECPSPVTEERSVRRKRHVSLFERAMSNRGRPMPTPPTRSGASSPRVPQEGGGTGSTLATPTTPRTPGEGGTGGTISPTHAGGATPTTKAVAGSNNGSLVTPTVAPPAPPSVTL